MILTIVFWFCVLALFHSYVLYPLLLKVISLGNKGNSIQYNLSDTDMPTIYVVFSVYNEEGVIREKMESIFKTTYPAEKLKVYVGSDCSGDNTDRIVQEFADKFSQLVFISFTERGGKSNVLNKLMERIEQSGLNKFKDLLVFTDANVIFKPETLYELAKHFKNENISQVGANIMSKGIRTDGISFQEKSYIRLENTLKYLEGLNWGSMIGAFGACYAMRADCWKEIPRNYLMEDFYLSMNVLSKNKKAILEPKAVCYEDVSNEVQEEFKRKSRIQAGNFQNLSTYWKLLFRFDATAFCFLSHKVIRWTGPFFIILAYLTNIFLIPYGLFYTFIFVVQNLLWIAPVMDFALKRIGLHFLFLRFASYFMTMNLALANGFVMYVRGIKTNAWNPTKRNL